MADDTITLVSTSDTPEQVMEALTGRPSDAKKPADPKPDAKPEPKPDTPAPAEPPKEPAAKEPAPAEPPADETPEQKETREASEAGTRLNKRKQSIQSEIDELTGRKYSVRRDVEAEEARLVELKRMREELEAQSPKPKEPGKDAKADEIAERPEPKVDATDDAGTAKYATYEEFLSDHAKWAKEQSEAVVKRALADKEKADRERIERESVSRVANEHLAQYQTKLEEFKKTHADFDAAYDDAKEEAQSLRIAMGPDVFRTIDGYTVFDAEDGPNLTYYLLKHPDELKAIAAKPPAQQVIHLTRLEARIRPEAAKKSGPASSAAPETKAPEPIKPVGSGPTATSVPLDEESYQDYKARRERELRARRSA